jgi:tetratricopeptide (TPR) repeat protein
MILIVAASVAFALPAPKDISAAVNAGHLPQAEAMLQEVIKEKPGSAKAHYELGQVLAREGRKIEARQELLEAQRLDPSLKFAKDPLRFNELLNRMTAATPAPAAKMAEPIAQPVVTAPTPPSFPWGYVMLGGGALLLVGWMVRRKSAVSPMMPAGATSSGSAMTGAPTGYAAGSYNPPPAAGSGVGGAAIGGIAGLAAGYGLAKVLENGTPAHAAEKVNSGFVPIDQPAQEDYGSFDAGSGDSWDSDDSSSGADSW